MNVSAARSRLSTCLFVGLLAPLAVAQDPRDAAGTHTHRSPILAVDGCAGLQREDGAWIGAGDDYKVRFDAHGFVFTPALGPRAPRNHTLRYRLESIARDGASLELPAVEPRAEELRVEYARGAVRERYELFPHAMEQSFVLEELPAGAGDLVVRASFASELAVRSDGEGLRFELPGIASCSLGAVTGIDAAGRRVRGTVRHAPGRLEYVLPAAFADAAALPLVIDPLIGSSIYASDAGGSDDQAPILAYEATSDVYLAVFTRVFSATDFDIHGQRLVLAGSLLFRSGNRLLIENSTTLDYEPQVASSDGANAFLVSFTRNGDVVGRAVDAQTGLLSPVRTIAGGLRSIQHRATLSTVIGSSDVLCCWQSDSDLALHAAPVRLSAGPDFALAAPARVVVDSSRESAPPENPRLAKSDGGRGRHGLAFERRYASGANPDVRFVLVDGSGAAILPEFGSLDATTAVDERPEIDGDGSTWIVAWQRLMGAGNRDVVARIITYNLAEGSYRLGSSVMPIATGNDDQSTPSVTWTGDNALVGWMQQTSPNSSSWIALLRSVDPFTCLRCESASFYILQPPTSGLSLQTTPFGAGVFSGAPHLRDEALLVWEINGASSGLNGDIAAQAYRAEDGIAIDLGGGCGTGGETRATCATLDNGQFQIRLRDTRPQVPCALLLSPLRAPFACGPCRLETSLAFLLSFPRFSIFDGHTAVPFPIPLDPALQGASLIAQWAVLPPSNPACPTLGLELSNALDVRIQ